MNKPSEHFSWLEQEKEPSNNNSNTEAVSKTENTSNKSVSQPENNGLPDLSEHENNANKYFDLLETEGENDNNKGRKEDINESEKPTSESSEANQAAKPQNDPKNGKIVPDKQFYLKVGKMRFKLNDVIAKRIIGWLKEDAEWHTNNHIAGQDAELLSEAWAYYMMSKGVIYSPGQYLVEVNMAIYGPWLVEGVLKRIGKLFKKKPIFDKNTETQAPEEHTYRYYEPPPPPPYQRPQPNHAPSPPPPNHESPKPTDHGKELIKCINCDIKYQRETGWPKNPQNANWGIAHSVGCYTAFNNKNGINGKNSGKK